MVDLSHSIISALFGCIYMNDFFGSVAFNWNYIVFITGVSILLDFSIDFAYNGSIELNATFIRTHLSK